MKRIIKKLLVANRGEIAVRIFRAANELDIKSIAIYTFEDRYSVHRYKADESYQIGKNDEPLKPYLDIDEIIDLALYHEVDAIHPGYGFLSENIKFAQRCEEVGIIFVGPKSSIMRQLGDKIAAKKVAKAAQVPTIPDNVESLKNATIAEKEAEKIGYPIVLKAASGGGGRGMRFVNSKSELYQHFDTAKREAAKAFGDDTMFMEKYLPTPKHIEVQIMADNHGNTVHLFERDCSVQRRFQKVVEMAPAPTLSQDTKQKLYNYALKIAKWVSYNNVGTVEFLVQGEDVYFIEVNPRVQVEHTVTEEYTGIDIVKNQILIACGYALNSPVINIQGQDSIQGKGFAVQCRITAEDPKNDFKPDFSTVIAYRNATGFGIRLDEGNIYAGITISPFFDSLIAKITARGQTLEECVAHLNRTLREYRIRGVKTNISFVRNIINHPSFLNSQVNVKFIDTHPELFNIKPLSDSATRVLKYIAHTIVNGNEQVNKKDDELIFEKPVVPSYSKLKPYPTGTKDLLNKLGRNGFIDWLKKEKTIKITDTTFRDAHQSLLATRFRTFDLLAVAESYAKHHPETFSMEVWGGATFDVCLRFLREDPWFRLKKIREKVPNILLQMLLRGGNAVGYKAYPNNLIEKFIEKSAETGIDIFRVFDSLNWIESMKISIQAVLKYTNSLVEGAISYTSDILNPNNKKYNLDYYLDLAKRLEDEGVHIIAIKDMAGLLKPYAAAQLIPALKEVVDLPIHLHTHDTSSAQLATYLKAIENGVDVVDVALASMSGLTSQPNFNTLIATMEGQKQAPNFKLESLNAFSNYWETVRTYYYPFESGLKAGTAEVYDHEIPGGQYSNLKPQAIGMGLGDRFEEVKKNYRLANELFGNIIKVTPSSKVIGDFAIFMTSNNLTPKDILENGENLSFPGSVKAFFKGDLGQPYQGFPKKLQKIVLKNEKALTDHPNKSLDPIDIDQEFKDFQKNFKQHNTFLDFLSYCLYPKVFEHYYDFKEKYGEVWTIPTLAFFYGLRKKEEILVELSKGKTLLIQYLFSSEPDLNGNRTVTFNLNGKIRRIKVRDLDVTIEKDANRKVDPEIRNEIGAPLQGRLSDILVKIGSEVSEDMPLFAIEAMKMETTVNADLAGRVKDIILKKGEWVEQDDLVLIME